MIINNNDFNVIKLLQNYDYMTAKPPPTGPPPKAKKKGKLQIEKVKEKMLKIIKNKAMFNIQYGGNLILIF